MANFFENKPITSIEFFKKPETQYRSQMTNELSQKEFDNKSLNRQDDKKNEIKLILQQLNLHIKDIGQDYHLRDYLSGELQDLIKELNKDDYEPPKIKSIKIAALDRVFAKSTQMKGLSGNDFLEILLNENHDRHIEVKTWWDIIIKSSENHLKRLKDYDLIIAIKEQLASKKKKS